MKTLLPSLALTGCLTDWQLRHDSTENPKDWQNFNNPGEPLDDLWVEAYDLDPTLEDGILHDYYRLEGFDPQQKQERMDFFAEMELCWLNDSNGDLKCAGPPESFEVEFSDGEYTSAFEVHIPLENNSISLAFINRTEESVRCIPVYSPAINDYYSETAYIFSSGVLTRYFSVTL